jgi:two-component system CheB/CheR fusion protein
MATNKGTRDSTPADRAELDHPSHPYPCLLIGVGASAGGLEAFGTLLRNLPEKAQLSLVLVTHLDPHHESVLAELLDQQTPLPVRQVTHDTPLECDRVYVIPPNQNMIVEQGVLKLSPQAGRTNRLPIDTFFASLAAERREKAVGVVLSGNASDGTLGLKAIKAEGGITFAQDRSARFESMPRTAIAAGVVDFVLPPQGIARELAALARHPYLAPTDTQPLLDEDGPLATILDMLRSTTGVDFAHYKAPTIQRRTLRRMALHKIERPEEYVTYLRQRPDELRGLCNDLLINVTEFFRDPDTFEALKQVAFPKIMQDRRDNEPFRVWVPGCSTGEEVYSIAITLLEYLETAHLRPEIQFFGTDVSEVTIDQARSGLYPKTMGTMLPPERLRRFFVLSEAGYQIARSIRDFCVFSIHNILRDPPLSRMDMVSCRNLLIYLRPLMQTRVTALLRYALKPSGCLLLGNSESLGAMAPYFTTLDKQHRMYCRNASVPEPPLDLPARIAPAIGWHGYGNPANVRQPEPGGIRQYVERHIAEFAPRAIVIDESERIAELRGNLQPILLPAAGAGASLDDALRPEIAEALHSALPKTRSENLPIRVRDLSFRTLGNSSKVDIQVLPITIPQAAQHYLVIFENLRATAPGSRQDENGDKDNQQQEVQQLEEKLESHRQYLQTVIEELRSSNEEVQSTNEELQSTNEELQTAKEELQASNEELRTINDEMQSRNADLSRAHNDLINLFSSMNLPILMLDNELRIRRFTPVSEQILHLIAADIGRPISDLNLRIKVPDLVKVLRDVIDTPMVFEREVQSEEGRWYSMRVRPYRTTENRLDGAVLQLLDIDEIKRDVEELKQARNYSEAIVNTVREPLIVLDEKHCLRTANSSFYQRFRVAPSHAANQVIFDLANGKLDRPELRYLLASVEGSANTLKEVEIDFDWPDDGNRTLVVNARALRLGDKPGLILLAFEDITERKLEAEARYRRLFETAKDGILVADADSGVLIDVNPYAEQMLGIRRSEMMGRNVWELAPFQEAGELRNSIPRIREAGVVRFSDVTLCPPDGRTIQTEIIGNVYPERGRSLVQFNIRDISERKKFFREIQETQKLESLGLLAGGIAHDFNNLLTGIMGNASLALADTAPDHPARVYLRDVVRATEHASHLTHQMLAYAGKGQFVTEAVDVSDLLTEIHALIRTSIPKNVNMQFDLMQHPPAVTADRSQIRQLLMNLVINAGEAIPPDRGGTVSLHTGVREITAREAADHFAADEIGPGLYLVIQIADTGIGMDETTKARIFDPFFTTKFTGRGLGLAAAMGIVKSHGGTMRVRSSPGEGSTFTVLLPAMKSPPKASDAQTVRKPVKGQGGLILVVDDEPDIRQIAERALTRAGYDVLLAADGTEGSRVFSRNKNRISLVILDLTMPKSGGEDTLRRLKKARKDIPVILTSGYDETESMRRFGEEDLAGFLRKPFTIDRLLEQVNALLGPPSASPGPRTSPS